MNERERLIESARAVGLTLGSAEAAKLATLLDELARWNRAYNLTAIADRGRMLSHHLLDSLAVHAHLSGETVVDVGTGAGFPGLPLAVVDPARRFTLVDSAGKKTRFVAHAARVLRLENVQVVHARAESLQPVRPFDTVIARALAPLPELLTIVRGLCGPSTRVLAMKGAPSQSELEGTPHGWRIVEVLPLSVPGVSESRHLVIAQPSNQ